MKSWKYCSVCHEKIPIQAKKCPKCHEEQKMGCLFVIPMFFSFIWLTGIVCGAEGTESLISYLAGGLAKENEALAALPGGLIAFILLHLLFRKMAKSVSFFGNACMTLRYGGLELNPYTLIPKIFAYLCTVGIPFEKDDDDE